LFYLVIWAERSFHNEAWNSLMHDPRTYASKGEIERVSEWKRVWLNERDRVRDKES